MEEVAEKNKYNLNIPRYVDTSEEEEEIDIEAAKKEIAAIEIEKKKAIAELEAMMKLLNV